MTLQIKAPVRKGLGKGCLKAEIRFFTKVAYLWFSGPKGHFCYRGTDSAIVIFSLAELGSGKGLNLSTGSEHG